MCKKMVIQKFGQFKQKNSLPKDSLEPESHVEGIGEKEGQLQ